MPQDADARAWPLRARTRRTVARLAAVACPPSPPPGELADALVAEFAMLLSVLPAGLRRSVQAGLAAFGQGARLYPAARGRRFASLADPAAEAYLRAILSIRRGGIGTAMQRIKGLVVYCYYELPEVKEQLGYRPDAYIAEVSRRRLASYGPQIKAGELAVLAPEARHDPGAP